MAQQGLSSFLRGDQRRSVTAQQQQQQHAHADVAHIFAENAQLKRQIDVLAFENRALKPYTQILTQTQAVLAEIGALSTGLNRKSEEVDSRWDAARKREDELAKERARLELEAAKMAKCQDDDMMIEPDESQEPAISAENNSNDQSQKAHRMWEQRNSEVIGFFNGLLRRISHEGKALVKEELEHEKRAQLAEMAQKLELREKELKAKMQRRVHDEMESVRASSLHICLETFDAKTEQLCGAWFEHLGLYHQGMVQMAFDLATKVETSRQHHDYVLATLEAEAERRQKALHTQIETAASALQIRLNDLSLKQAAEVEKHSRRLAWYAEQTRQVIELEEAWFMAHIEASTSLLAKRDESVRMCLQEIQEYQQRKATVRQRLQQLEEDEQARRTFEDQQLDQHCQKRKAALEVECEEHRARLEQSLQDQREKYENLEKYNQKKIRKIKDLKLFKEKLKFEVEVLQQTIGELDQQRHQLLLKNQATTGSCRPDPADKQAKVDHYDLCIEMEPTFSSIGKAEGWALKQPVDHPPHQLHKCYGPVVGVYGPFNAGKTAFINLMVNCGLPCGVHTKGLCVKQVCHEEQMAVVLDCTGRGFPSRSGSSTEWIQENEAKESFVRDLTFYMADVFIEVVGEITGNDQAEVGFLGKRLQSEWGSSLHTFRKIIILHNLKDVGGVEAFQAKVEQIKALYAGCAVKQQEVHALGHTESIEYLDGVNQMGDGQGLEFQMHFWIAQNGSPAGHLNPYVATKILQLIRSVPIPKNEFHLFDRLKTFMKPIFAELLEPPPADLNFDEQQGRLRLVGFPATVPTSFKLRSFQLGPSYLSTFPQPCGEEVRPCGYKLIQTKTAVWVFVPVCGVRPSCTYAVGRQHYHILVEAESLCPLPIGDFVQAQNTAGFDFGKMRVEIPLPLSIVAPRPPHHEFVDGLLSLKFSPPDHHPILEASC